MVWFVAEVLSCVVGIFVLFLFCYGRIILSWPLLLLGRITELNT